MARIRTIKPEFWRNDDLSTVSAEAALLAIGLLNHCDDEGYFNANPNILKADIFPLRDLSSSTTVLLRELYEIGYLELFIDDDSLRFKRIYGRVVNFAKHQVINKPNSSNIKELNLLPYDYGSATVVLPPGKERKGKEREREREREVSPIGENEKPDKPSFENFYGIYPKKVNRQEAEKVWKKITAIEASLIFQDLPNRIANHWQWQDKQFIPAPDVYLRNKLWTDEIIPPKPNGNHSQQQPLVYEPSVFAEIMGNNFNCIDGETL